MSIPTHAPSPGDTITRKAAAIDLLRQHATREAQLTTARIALINASRHAGLSWAAIGDALGRHHEAVRVQHLKATQDTKED